jgi:DNA repair protein RadC
MSETYRMTMKEMPIEDRPREKLQRLGPSILSTAELLAILLRTGTKTESAVTLAQRLLNHFGSLPELQASSVDELSGVKGIGLAKAAEIKAALELANRLAVSKGESRPVIYSPEDIAKLLMTEMRWLQKEYFKILLLNTKNQVLASPIISVGSLNASIVHPREVFKEAIRCSAAAIILVHNHPSGDPSPSVEDISITKRLSEVGKLMDIAVLDHVIIGDGKYVSLKEKGIL